MSAATLRRRLLAGAALWLSLGASAAGIGAETTAWGSHGMAVFGGRDALYASHLPMFHAPHDMQVVLRFHLQDRQNDARLRAALAAQAELWTLEPQEFDLLRLQPGHAAPLRQFGARLVQGHFERGGQERYAGQTVIVEQVLLFRRLSGQPRRQSEGRYHLLGSGRERFLLKEIDRRPDFDLIMALRPLTESHAALPALISVPGDALQPPTLSAWRKILEQQAGPGVTPGPVLYFETGDLQ